MGKCAIITGASRGIGAAIAKRLASDGYDVVINDINEEAAQSTAKECECFGVKAIAFKADVSNFTECEALVKTAVDTFGGIFVLVNNAGITRDNLLLRMSEEQFDDVIRINLKSTFNMTRLASPVMLRAKEGRIINISSVAGVYGNAGQVNYSASKAGVIGITKSAAKELGSRGITVNAIAPGFIETSMTKDLPEAVRQGALNAISLKRFGKPEDIAAIVSFLASEDSAYITGQVIIADGGLSM